MGSDAFLRLACLPQTRVTCNALLHTSLARNIPCSWDALMLRAATLVDDVQERMVRGFDHDTPPDPHGQVGPVERPTFAGPPPGHPAHAAANEFEEALDFGQNWQPSGQTNEVGPFDFGAEGYVHTGQEAYPQAPNFDQMGLHDLVQAANAAEDAGRPADALAILEQAVVRFPGHPEILLAVLRLQKQHPQG